MVSETKQSGSIIIGRCSCDPVVKYPFYWSEEIVEEANKKGFNIIDLKNENFVENKFSKYVEDHKPNIIFLNGHGDDFAAMGFQKSPVLMVNKNDHLLIGKVAHIISCFTANFLAQSAMDKGCNGYLGYKNYFYIWFIEDNPKDDIIATMFQEAVNVASKTLLEGGGVKKAFEKSQEAYEKRINECKGKYFDPSTTQEMRDNLQDIISALIMNKKHQIYFSLE